MSPTPSPAPPPAPLSEFSRIAGVFFSPKEAFADIIERPRWIIPVIILTISTLAFVTAYSQHVGWEKVVRQQMEQSSRTQSMTPEQREQAISIGVKFGSVIGYVQAAIMPLIMVLIASGVLMFMANSMAGTQLRYPQMMGITGYAFLTGVVSTILMTIVMFLKSAEDFDIRNPLAFNAGAFLSAESTPKWLMAIATSLDLFSFWTIALLAIGISCAGRKIPFGKALPVVLIPWALVVAIKAAWMGLFG